MDFNIRFASKEDAAGIAEIYRPIVTSTAISFEVKPPDSHEIERRIQETLPAYPWLVCEHHGRVAGYAYASKHRARAAYQWSVDASVYVHPDFRRRGIGKSLYVPLFQVLAAQGYFNAFAGIALPNPGSVSFHESVGFRPVGVYRNVGYKFGAWHDVGWWHLVLQAPTKAPQPPRSLGEIQRDPLWSEMLAAGLSCIHDES
jgi:phosphinothricin acetyltransferase